MHRIMLPILEELGEGGVLVLVKVDIEEGMMREVVFDTLHSR